MRLTKDPTRQMSALEAYRAQRLKRLLIIAFLIDVLFAPFVLPFHPTILLWPVWFAMTGNVSHKSYYLQSLFVPVGMIILSYLLGTYSYSLAERDEFARLANSGVIAFMFIMYPFCEDNARHNLKVMILLFRIYLLFSFLLAMVFAYDPYNYFFLREFWSYGDSVVKSSTLDTSTRFTGILSDPNNMAISLCAVFSAQTAFAKRDIKKGFFLLMATALVVVATMSVTGFICLAFSSLHFLYVVGYDRSSADRVFLSVLVLAFLSICLIAGFYLLEDSLFFRFASDRLRDAELGSRTSKWGIIFDPDKILNAIFLGDGGSVFWLGGDFKPHNGHLHILFSFGLMVYLFFVRRFFPFKALFDPANAMFLLILLVGFTVNVGIYEPRFAAIWIASLGMYRFHISCLKTEAYERRGAIHARVETYA